MELLQAISDRPKRRSCATWEPIVFWELERKLSSHWASNIWMSHNSLVWRNPPASTMGELGCNSLVDHFHLPMGHTITQPPPPRVTFGLNICSELLQALRKGSNFVEVPRSFHRIFHYFSFSIFAIQVKLNSRWQRCTASSGSWDVSSS